MKKIIRFLSIAIVIVTFIFAFDSNAKASNINVEMKEGARIRKDSILALSFEATVTNAMDNATYGFIYSKGTLTKEQLLAKQTTTEKTVEIDGDTITLPILVDIENIDVVYSALAFVKIDDEVIYASNTVSRSVLQVANNLSENEESYVTKIKETANTYYDTTIILNANGGVFDNSTDTLTVSLKDPCDFPNATKSGYRVLAWKDNSSNELYKTYPGTRKEGTTRTFTAIWEEIPTAKTLINQLIPETIQDGDEIPLEFEGDELVWNIEENDYFSYANGKFTLKKVADHYTHEVNVTLEYKGETATAVHYINPIELKDLTGKSPFAIYFAVGSLSNYTSYTGHSVNNLFSDEIKNELDIVYYSFAYPTASGTLTMSKPSNYSTIYKQLMDLRKNGTRIVLSIAGTSSEACGYFNTICESATLRATFVKNLVDLIEQENFDGIDIDWESASSENCVVATRLTNLMKDLRTEMNRRTGDGPKYLLTCAAPATSWGASSDRFNFKKINSYLDYVNMMSYDLNSEEKATHVSALYTSSNDKGYGFGANYGAKLFINLGLSKNKIIIGTAAYGKAYKNVEAGTNTTYPGLGQTGTLGRINGITGSFNSGTIYYNGVLQLMNNSNYKQYTEYNSKGEYVGNYLYSATDKIFVAYEGEEMILKKVEYAKANGYGVMIWSYCEDGSGNLCQVIAENIHK